MTVSPPRRMGAIVASGWRQAVTSWAALGKLWMMATTPAKIDRPATISLRNVVRMRALGEPGSSFFLQTRLFTAGMRWKNGDYRFSALIRRVHSAPRPPRGGKPAGIGSPIL